MRIIALLLLAAFALPAQQGWWMTEPLRWLQTNLRETDAALDPDALVRFLDDYRANVLLLNMGGIVAQYSTKLPFHYASTYMPAGRDTFGEVLRLAHGRSIRVVGRFDFSKTQKAAFDAHPDWFFRKADGAPVIYNGLYSTCINGGYYRDYALRILAEALERYDVDGLFFNMFGNQSTDYSGAFVGHCRCDNCRRRYRELYARELPDKPDDRYREFMFLCSREVAAEIGKLVHAKRPRAGYFNYIEQSTDGIMSESNTAVNRPLPLWPYASSENVNRARNSEPGKMAVNLCMQFVDYPWRFATVPGREIALRLWQNVAHGGALALAINGTPAGQQDRQALDAARPVFGWLAAHESFYAGQQSAARVLLLAANQAGGGPFSQASYRGLFRLLTEQHIPFAVSSNLDWLGKREFDLVVAADWAPAALEGYVHAGGRLLLASAHPPGFPLGRPVRTWQGVQGYMRVRDHRLLPSLERTDLLMLNGDYLELAPTGASALTLVPPSMFGPPEKIHVDMADTDKPGLLLENIGQGRVAWLPWDTGGLYYRHSLDAHGNLLKDLVDLLLPEGRQLVTNAHPLIEFSLMRQGERTLLHAVNMSGHSDTAYFAPLAATDIRIEVAGEFASARAQKAGAGLAVRRSRGRTSFTLPRLEDYELVVLEK